MSEYDLICDVCGQTLLVDDAIVSWHADGDMERGFALTHAACVAADADQRAEVRRLVWPNEYLAFATARFGKRIDDTEPLRAIVWALAPFVMRHDNAVEMESMRAASIGQRLGVKPGTEPPAGTSHAPPPETDAGK